MDRTWPDFGGEEASKWEAQRDPRGTKSETEVISNFHCFFDRFLFSEGNFLELTWRGIDSLTGRCGVHGAWLYSKNSNGFDKRLRKLSRHARWRRTAFLVGGSPPPARLFIQRVEAKCFWLHRSRRFMRIRRSYASWGGLGTSGDRFEPILVGLGYMLGSLGRSWEPLGASWGDHGGSWGLWELLGEVSGASWSPLVPPPAS